MRSARRTVLLILVFLITNSSIAGERSGPNPDNFSPIGTNSADLFTGSFTNSYPIELPPGRNGQEPDLDLIYNSHAGNGWLGLGWSLSWGTIHRKTLKGSPTYNDAVDKFLFSLSGVSAELVPVGGGEYRAQIESSFLRFKMISASEWRVWDKKGKQYQFLGLTPKGSSFYDWDLRKITDPSGNQIEFKSYHEDLSQPTPQIQTAEIRYTEKSNGTYKNVITFEMEDRPDISSDYRAGTLQRISKRLKRILITVDGTPWKKYEMSYTNNEATTSLLTSIQRFGFDRASSGWQAFPTATTFTYSTPQQGWQQSSNFNPPVDFVKKSGTNYLLYKGVQPVDVNGDGLVDLVQNFASESSVFLATPSGFVPNTQFTLPVAVADRVSVDGNPDHDLAIDNGVRFADINGDGLPDIIQAQDGSNYNSTYTLYRTWINTGTGWVLSPQWNSPVPVVFRVDLKASGDAGVRFVDVNGDGLLDIVQSRIHLQIGTPFGNVVGTWLNNGNGWTSAPGWNVPTQVVMAILDYNANPHTVHAIYQAVYFADINGDGLCDIIQGFSNDPGIGPATETRKAWLNTGSGWVAAPQWDPPAIFYYWQGYPLDTGIRLMDINGDNKPDLTLRNSSGFTTSWLNTGSGWKRDDNFGPPINMIASKTLPWISLPSFGEGPRGVVYVGVGYSSEDDGIGFGDINGDGLVDFYKSKAGDGAIRQAFINTSPIPYRLKQIRNELGGTSTIQYGPYIQSNTPAFRAMTVVKTVTNDDGMGNQIPSNFSYEGGLTDKLGSEREFLGFNKVKVTDGKGHYSVTRFLQTENAVGQLNVFKGKIAEKTFFNSSNTALKRTLNTYSVTSPYPQVYFPFLNQVDDTMGTKTSQVKYQYDTVGNLTQQSFLGDVQLGGDERTELTEYAANLTDYLVGYPSHKKILGADGNTKSETWFSYDGAANYSQPPTKGLLTKIEQWLNTGSNVVTTRAYDAYGNLTDEYDPLWNQTAGTLGNHVRWIYDAEFHQFPESRIQGTGSINLTDVFTYDTMGGQLLSQRNPNNQTTQNQYDAFSRLTAVIGPTDSSALPTMRYDYNVNGAPPHSLITHSRIESGQSSTLDNYTFFDGQGRQRAIKTPLRSGFQAVSGMMEFDNSGLRLKEFHPFESPASAGWASPPANQPFVEKSYDALGRVLNSREPDQSVTQTTYQDWTTFVQDANGHIQSMEVDAFGQTIVRREPTIAVPTTYQYDALGNLIRVIDSKEKSTTMTYDSLGRKIGMTDPNAGSRVYRYDNNGNLIEETDARGVKISLTYDRLNRIVAKTMAADPLGVTGQPINTSIASYVYDQVDPVNRPFSLGKLTTMTDLTGSTQFTHDALGRVTKETKLVNNIIYTTRTTFDLINRPTQITYPSDQIVKYSYANSPYLNQVTNNDGTLEYASFPSYDALGRPLEMLQSQQKIKTTYTYNPLRHWPATQKVEITTSTPFQVIQSLSYNFDPIGNLMGIQDQLYPARSQQFQYDELDRLKQVQGGYGMETYTYDSAHNFQSKAGMVYSYQDVTHPYAVTDIQTSSGAITFAYDPNGCLSSKIQSGTTWTYRLNAQGLLSEVRKNGGLVGQYIYDANGNRAQKKIANTSTSYVGKLFELRPNDLRISHIYAGEKLIADILQQNTDIQEPVRRLLNRTPRPIPQLSGPQITYYHLDHLGSVSMASDSNAQLIQQIQYKPYGETLIETGTSPTHKKFTSQEEDLESGFIYFGARFYDPKVGAFSSVDPELLDTLGKDKRKEPYWITPKNLSPYAYAWNNPIRRKDPTGRYQEDVHYDLTFYLAINTGFSYKEARLIAFSDQYTDDNPKTSPWANDQARTNFHFTTPERRQEMRDAAFEKGSFKLFGEYLHAAQDSFSHAGYKAPLYHGYTTAPDLTYKRPELADKMARFTYGEMQSFMGSLGRAPRNDWGAIESTVMSFNRSETYQSKLSILNIRPYPQWR